MTWEEIKQGPAAKTYLGDGVYAEFNEYQQVVLSLMPGSASEPDTIFLDPCVWDALTKYVERVHAAVRDLMGQPNAGDDL